LPEEQSENCRTTSRKRKLLHAESKSSHPEHMLPVEIVSFHTLPWNVPEEEHAYPYMVQNQVEGKDSQMGKKTENA